MTTSSAATTLVITGHGLRPRGGHEPVGRLRLCAARLERRADPAPLLPRHRSVGTRTAAQVRVLLATAAPSVTRRLGRTVARRRRRRERSSRCRPGRSTVPASLRLAGQEARLAAHLRAGHARRSRRRASPTAARSCSPPTARPLQLVNVVSPRGLSRRRRRRGGAVDVAAAPRSRHRRSPPAPTRSPRPRPSPPSSPFDLYADVAKPGLRRHPGRDAGGHAGRRRDPRAASSSITGQVATTYFSASSGGETMSSADGIGTPVPYLVSVPDPWDTLSPYHDWGPVLLSARDAAKALGLAGGARRHRQHTRPVGPGRLGHRDHRPRRPSRSRGSRCATSSTCGSSWFQLGLLSLDPVRAPVAYPARRSSSAGVVRGVGDVSLEAQGAGRLLDDSSPRSIPPTTARSRLR